MIQDDDKIVTIDTLNDVPITRESLISLGFKPAGVRDDVYRSELFEYKNNSLGRCQLVVSPISAYPYENNIFPKDGLVVCTTIRRPTPTTDGSPREFNRYMLTYKDMLNFIEYKRKSVKICKLTYEVNEIIDNSLSSLREFEQRVKGFG